MYNKRLKLLLAFFTISIILLAIRILYIQVYMGERLSISATGQRVSNLDIINHRGSILDRNSIPFTSRDTKVEVAIKPLYLRGNEREIQKIADILGVNYIEIKRLIDLKKDPIIYPCDEYIKEIFIKEEIAGISFIHSLHRHTDTSYAKHILGYLNKVDHVGETGIEKSYEHILGLNKKSSVGVITDAKENLVPGLGYRFIQPDDTRKLHVKLTLNYHIQKIAEDVLENSGLKGAVVIEDVLTGDILAMVSKPDFNPGEIDKYLKSSDKELFNRAVASYNLGSIFKIVNLASSNTEDINPNLNYFCPGYIVLGDKEFRCTSYESGGHGLINLTEAFASSCNSYFIELGIKIGPENILKTAQKFGLGDFTGINTQGVEESSGHLPPINQFYTHGDTANISIGQGDILATPLQVANMVATIANGGIKNKVNIVDSIIDCDGNTVKIIKEEKGVRVLPKDICDNIKKLMEEVTVSGTGTKANLDLYGGAGGKTGSAETGQFIGGEKVVHAWFAGYFPKKNPRYSMSVFIENGKSGGKIAAPVFEEIAKNIMIKGF
ncbi:UNVERIFIED_CONTAM: peptidoglycan glycosyltransferase/penicillin-binding protein 2 [Acetivibrio alkalicellulosi]